MNDLSLFPQLITDAKNANENNFATPRRHLNAKSSLKKKEFLPPMLLRNVKIFECPSVYVTGIIEYHL